MKRVILEGCNGDWSQKQYLPVLAKEADKGDVELWTVDIEPQMKLTTPEVTTLWQRAESKGKACYLDKRKDRETYERLSNVDYVFIVTSDQYHCQVAKFWLERLASEGKIFIEKPLDDRLAVAEMLKKHIEAKGAKESVFGFDHYLARAYPFLLKSGLYSKQIGDSIRIEFHLLDDYGELIKRAGTLDRGAIFDLFCHVLAVVCATVSQNTTCLATELATIELDETKAARHSAHPISGETFARIKFTVNRNRANRRVTSDVGYHQGGGGSKFMRLEGTGGKIELDFARDEFAIFESQGKLLGKGKLLDKHVERFLEEIVLENKHPLSVPGVLSFEAALEILKILDEAKAKISKLFEYECNDSYQKILGILGERKPR